MNDLLDENKIEQAILEYLAEQPLGADTVVGIADWWLTRHRARVVVEMVERVLDRLVSKQVLETSEEGGRRIYYLRR